MIASTSPPDLSPRDSTGWLVFAGAISLAISAALLLYNVLLLEILSNQAEFSIDEAQSVVAFGRWASAFALAWLLFKGFLVVDWRRAAVYGLIGAVIVGCATFGIERIVGWTMVTAVKALPNDLLYRAYQLAYYRYKVANGEIVDPELPIQVPVTSAADQVLIAGFGLAAFDDRIAGIAERMYQDEGMLRVAKARGMLISDWATIKAGIDKLDDAETKLAAAPAQFEAGYQQFLRASALGSNSGWLSFTALPQLVQVEILLHTCGMPAAPGASREAFAQALTKSQCPDKRAGGDWYLNQAAYERQLADARERVLFDSRVGHVIKVRDLPRPFTQSTVLPWYDTQAKRILSDFLPRADNIKASKFGIHVAATILFPPLLIALTLTSIALNAIGGAWHLIAAVTPARRRGLVAMAGLPIGAVMVLVTLYLMPAGFAGTSFSAAETSAISAHSGYLLLSKYFAAERILLDCISLN